MASHILLAFSNPIEGREEEFNAWYNERHLDDVLRVSGYVSAQRFELSPTQMMPDGAYRYLAIYEVEADDLEATSKALQSMAPEDMPVTEAWDYDRCETRWYSPITDLKSKTA